MSNQLNIASKENVNHGVDQFTSGLHIYLDELGLPKEKVLVDTAERQRVINNLPDVVLNIGAEKRRTSIYLSKFIAACGAGLFDAALNFIWDETIVSLRAKVVKFDIDYFYDSVINDTAKRSKFKDDSDLIKIEDWELIRGCHLTGILSDIGYKHLDYIRDMRNWASAAHPNQNELTGFQLVAWLETCIKEVITKEPEGPAIEIRRFLISIKSSTLNQNDAMHIKAGIEHLTQDLATSLTRTLFGMYTNSGTAAQIRNNIKMVAKKAWAVAPEEIRYECGFKYSNFATNGETDRKNLANEYLAIVEGHSFLPKDTLALEMSEKIQNLYSAHTGMNNFYNEPAHAKSLSHYVSTTGEVPDAVRRSYIKTIVMAKIGNGYGISTMAESYYDELISRFGENEIREFVSLFSDREFSSRVSLNSCRLNYKSLASSLRTRTTNQISQQILGLISKANDTQLPSLGKETAYKKLIESFSH